MDTHQSRLPSLAERRSHFIHRLTTSKKLFHDYALSGAGVWLGNFRDLNAFVVRIATLSPGGRISLDLVREEIERLSSAKLEANETQDTLSDLLGKERLDGIDFFDQVQLASVIRVCRDSR